MACSKYASTRQTTHAARMSRLLCGPCTDVFRDVLRQYISEKSFPATLQKGKVKKKLLKLRSLTKPQKAQLYPKFSGTYDDLDISLLYLLLRNVTKITPHKKGWGYSPDESDRSVSANIDRIRIIRNRIGVHCHRPDLSDAVFSTSWAKLKRSVVEIVTKAGISTNYEQCINDLVKEPMDPVREEYWLQRLEEVRNQRARNILDYTKAVLQSHKISRTYFKTKQVDIVIQKLRQDHIVMLTGRPGDGKSTIAKQVLCELSEGDDYVPVIISKPSEWNKVVNSKHRMVVYVDDIFGSTNVDTGAIDKWKKIFELMVSPANEGEILAFFSSRGNIGAELRKSCNEYFFINPEYEIDLTANVLTSEEKESILLRYENEHTYKASNLTGDQFREYEKEHGTQADYVLTKSEKNDILSSEPYYGFPQTCFLFFVKKDFYQLGTRFFLRPSNTLFCNIDNMRKSTDVKIKMCYCILVYVFLEGNIHKMGKGKDTFEEICKKTNLSTWKEVDIEDSIQELDGIYLSPSNQKQVYTFCHVTIQEAVAVSFGKLAPDIVIKKCNDTTIKELIRTEDYEAREGEVILNIRNEYYPLLANRLLTLNAHCIGVHPAIDDPNFAKVLIDVINESPDNCRATIGKLWNKDNALIREMLTQHGLYPVNVYGSIVSVDELDSNESMDGSRDYDSMYDFDSNESDEDDSDELRDECDSDGSLNEHVSDESVDDSERYNSDNEYDDSELSDESENAEVISEDASDESANDVERYDDEYDSGESVDENESDKSESERSENESDW